MKTITEEQFKKQYGEETVSKFSTRATSRFAVPTGKELLSAGRDVSTGLVKGAMQSGTGLVQGINALGTATAAALNPNETYQSLKDRQVKAGSVFTGPKAEQINQQLKAQNTGEKVGKSLEFIGELFTPTGVRTATSKVASEAGGIFKGVGSKIAQIPEELTEGGVKVKDKVADLLVNLDEKTKTALDRTPKEVFDKFVEQGRQAVTDDRIRTPLESVGDDIIDSLTTLKNKASEIGAEKSTFLKYPETFSGKGVKQFKEGVQSFLNSRSMIDNDKPVVKKIVEEFKKLGSTPSKGQVDKFIDYSQEALYSGEKNLVQPVSNKTVSQLRGLVSKLNQSLKEQLPKEYSKLNDEYSELKRISSEINTRLGKEGSNAGSFVKRLFSPSDARTKELFSELERLTGKDFTRDARLAKFVMEALGDTRAASILEQIPTSAKGALNKVVDFATQKLSDPIKAGERYINQKAK